MHDLQQTLLALPLLGFAWMMIWAADRRQLQILFGAFGLGLAYCAVAGFLHDWTTGGASGFAMLIALVASLLRYQKVIGKPFA